VYQFIHNNPQFQFVNRHVKDGAGNMVTDDDKTSSYLRKSGKDDLATIELTSALEESIDYERKLFASFLKSERLKGIDSVANNKRINSGGGGLYTFDDDREYEEGANRVANVAVDNENTHATDKVVIPPAIGEFKKEKEDHDESYESLLLRAKEILKLIRIAQHQERMRQIKHQHHLQVEGKPSVLPSASPLHHNTLDTSTRASARQSQPKLESERTVQQPQYQQCEKGTAAGEQQQQQLQLQQQQQLEATTGQPSQYSNSQPVEAVEAFSTNPLHKDQRTAMGTFLSSPTVLNWNELVGSMRKQRHEGESGEPRYSSRRRRRHPINIQTITMHKQLDELDEDGNSSLTLSSSSRSPNQPSQSQQPLQDNQRTAMELFISSPTGLNWDDLVESIRKERVGNCRSRDVGGRSVGGRFNITSITVYCREEGDFDDMSSLGMQGRDDRNYHRHRKQREQWKQEQQQLQQDGNSTAKNEEGTMQDTTVDVKSSFPSKRHSRRERDRKLKDVVDTRRNKDKRSWERRIEHVLSLTSTDAEYIASANIGGEMILNDLKNTDESIALY
jgi:hypothetical protein